MSVSDTPKGRRWDMHFEGIDGTFTIRTKYPTTRDGAYKLALELAKGRIECFVRGITEVENNGR